MEKLRCSWCNPKNPLYIQYHDEEWGNPVYDDRILFEFLILESFQAGLSWEIILNKRENFRRAFAEFDPNQVASFTEQRIAELSQDASIIRNRRKIRASVNNAKVFLQIQKNWGSFSDYIWHFTDHHIIYENDKTSSPLSDVIADDLKKQGMQFVGTTILYSYLQAVGVINSHETNCFLFHSKGAHRKQDGT